MPEIKVVVNPKARVKVAVSVSADGCTVIEIEPWLGVGALRAVGIVRVAGDTPQVSLVDLLAWLAAQLHPVVVTVAPAASDDSLLDWAPLLTTGVAGVGVWIASRALKASRQSADNSARSVEKADASLRGSVRPILTVATDQRALEIHVHNVGSGVALDVHAIIASVIVGSGGFPIYVGWFEESPGIPVLAPDGVAPMSLRPFDSDTDRSKLMILLTCRDVNGEVHWIHRAVGRSPIATPTALGVGEDYPEEVQRFLIEHREGLAKRATAHEARGARILSTERAQGATEPE
jgi:hypothetical protein